MERPSISSRPGPERIFLTGGSGFVGSWLRVELAARTGGRPFEIWPDSIDTRLVDVTDEAAVADSIRACNPTAVIHLAAIAAPADASSAPRKAWEVNLTGTMNVAAAVMKHAPQARFIYVGSSEAYGATFREVDGPLGEEAALKPMNVYGATKAAADILVGQMTYDGLKAVRFRPFNHTGPGQSEAYVVSAFARQIAEIAAGLRAPVVEVGNLSAERDFLDVRDVVRAYADAALGDYQDEPGLVFNLASGLPRTIHSVLQSLIAASGKQIEIRVDPARLRAIEVARAAGDAQAARSHFGWQPEISFEKTLADILENWRMRLSGGSSAADSKTPQGTR